MTNMFQTRRYSNARLSHNKVTAVADSKNSSWLGQCLTALSPDASYFICSFKTARSLELNGSWLLSSMPSLCSRPVRHKHVVLVI